MTIYRYKYTLVFFDEVDDCNKIIGGYVTAGSMAEALENLEKYYGKDNIEKISLEIETDVCVIELKEMVIFDADWKGPAMNTGW